MIRRPYILLISFIAILACALLGLRACFKTGKHFVQKQILSPAANPSPQPNGGVNSPPQASAVNKFDVTARLTAFQAAWAEANGKSLDFYGKIIDQNGRPVAGARVRGNVETVGSLEGPTWTSHITESNEDGNFEFLGFHGMDIPIYIEKAGYEFKQHDNDGWTKDYRASPTNRVIFHMWKIAGAEAMIHGKIHVYIPCDGTSKSYNLQAGRHTPGGDTFTVTLIRRPVDIAPRQRFEWTATLEVPNGGFMPTSDLYKYQAPATGYQRTVVIRMPVDATNWYSEVTADYYFFDGKNYGRITVDIDADFNPPPTLFDAEIYLNPSGSRNLEYDPAKQVNK